MSHRVSPPLRIAFAGTPAFAEPSLQALLDAGHDVVAVFSQPDRPAGRGRRLTAPPVKQRALAAGLPVFQPERLGVTELAAAGDPAPDLLVVVAFGQLLPPAVLEYPARGALNVHASLLPRWRGAAPIARALLAGDAETGVSIMHMTGGLDAGPVLARLSCSIEPDDTAASLHDRLAVLGARCLVDVLADLPARLAAAEPQDEIAVTHAPKLSRAEARIDWSGSAAAIERAVRAFHPWPGAFTTLDGDSMRILRARVEAESGLPAGEPPGTVLAADGDGIRVVTGRGILDLLEVQMAGRRRVGAADLANARQLAGCRLGAGQ